jgi:PKD repeat protein
VSDNQAPVAVGGATPTSGPAPLAVAFSSAGSLDPEGQAITYLWTFGDGTTSTAANPGHTYNQPGLYTARLAVSDGVNTTQSTPITISVGGPPTATILAPTDGLRFVAGDVITFSGNASDPEDGTLPASAFTWNVDFLHEGHVHPGTAQTGVKNGSFTIPTTGHDFSGNTRYRITLTVVDSTGLTATTSVTVLPTKVDLSFASAPSGLTLYVDGIARVTPFVYDTLVGFAHNVEARNQSLAGTAYTFQSWSDGGQQQHTIVVPTTNATYSATFAAASTPATPTFVQVNSATPQTDQTNVAVPYVSPQAGGNLNVVVVGFNNTTSNIASVTDTAGNSYQVAAPLVRGGGISQAIYYARNIRPMGAGANVVTVALDGSTPYVDIRIVEYAGLDTIAPFDVAASQAGTTASASSPTVVTGAAAELVFGAGTTQGMFTGAASGFTTRIITPIDADIVVDRNVTAVGSYSAGAALAGPANWIMQVATFRAAGQ